MLARALGLLTLVGALIVPAVARADDASTPSTPSTLGAPSARSKGPLRWDPAWTHAGPLDYALATWGMTALLVETAVLQNKQAPARWNQPILFDLAVRDATHGNNAQVRGDAATWSWVLWFGLMGYPLVVDVPYAWVRYDRQLAWDLFWQDAVTLSLSGATDLVLRDIFGRVRPGNYECLQAGGTTQECLSGPETVRSFPSGHFTETSTATALICTQHLTMHLYGSPGDAITCTGAIGADLAVGALRLIADNHWATDIIAGGAIGFLFGWGIPTVMHLHGHAPQTGGKTAWSPMIAPIPIVLNQGGGVGATGIF